MKAEKEEETANNDQTASKHDHLPINLHDVPEDDAEEASDSVPDIACCHQVCSYSHQV